MMRHVEQKSGRGVGMPGSLVGTLRVSVDRAGSKTAPARNAGGSWEERSYLAFWGRIRDAAAGLALLGVSSKGGGRSVRGMWRPSSTPRERPEQQRASEGG